MKILIDNKIPDNRQFRKAKLRSVISYSVGIDRPISSFLGRGSKSLNKSGKGKKSMKQKEENPGVITGVKILIVDDDSKNLYLLEVLLKGAGYEVFTAKNGIEALEKLRTNQFDGIISDILMPRMDGFQLIRECKKDPVLRPIPFIFYTATYTDKKDEEFGLSLGAIRYIIKPAEPDELLRIINECVRQGVSSKKAPVLENDVFTREYSRRVGAKLEKKTRLLAESEERFRLLYENSLDAILLTRPDGSIQAANPAAGVMFQRTEEDIIKTGRVGLVDTTDSRLPNALEEQCRTGRYAGELTFIREDGTRFKGEVTSSIFTDHHGHTRSPMIIRDITERKRAEDELRAAYEQIAASSEELRAQYDMLAESERSVRESEEKYRTVFETTGTATVLIENDMTISLVNSEFEHMSGFRKDEVENRKTWTEFVVKEDLDRMLAQHQLRKKNGESALKHYEFRFRSRTGEVRNIYLTIDVIPGTTKSVASLLDITERKRAEDELRAAYEQIAAGSEELRAQYDMLAESERSVRESEEKFKTLFESAGEAILIMDRDIFLDCNKKTERLFGCSRDQIVGKSPAIFSPEHQPDGQLSAKIAKEKTDAAFLGENHFFEWVYVRSDGTPFHAEVTLNRFMVGGTYYLQAIVRDITDRKRSQKALEQAKKKLNLLNYVTFNDIQNMIFTLSGYIHLSKGNVTESPVKLIIKKEDDILQNITHSLKFAQSYQDLGLRPPRWQNVHQVFLMAVSHLDWLRMKHTVTLDGLEIFADPLLEMVFQVLADNTLTHGKTATEVTLRYAKGSDSIALLFEDNGVGIFEDIKDKIFSPDFQNRKTVGLFLAREILEITGITITETGEPGKGVRFEIRVPKGHYRFATQTGSQTPE